MKANCTIYTETKQVPKDVLEELEEQSIDLEDWDLMIFFSNTKLFQEVETKDKSDGSYYFKLTPLNENISQIIDSYGEGDWQKVTIGAKEYVVGIKYS